MEKARDPGSSPGDRIHFLLYHANKLFRIVYNDFFLIFQSNLIRPKRNLQSERKCEKREIFPIRAYFQRIGLKTRITFSIYHNDMGKDEIQSHVEFFLGNPHSRPEFFFMPFNLT